MAKKQKKQEALSVSRLINEVLVAQLSIPFRQIVNDTTFSKYTGSKRPDILISEFEYDGTNDEQYIKNLVAYAEAKDDCKVEDKDWKDALKQGKIKAPKLGLPYFIVTNCKTTYFYNAKTLKQLTLNGNPIREFQTIDIYRLTDSNLNHTGIYLYSKGKIMIHLTFDYKTDEKCTTPGQYLKYHRTFQGLSTRELAEKVGIVPATLVLYENDRHPIKHSTAVALANALGIDRNRLLDKYTAFVDYPYSSLLKKVRQDLSLTQIQMAELIGIGQTSYSGWEREIRVPRRKEYDKILAALEKLRVNVDTYLCQSASI